MSCCCRSHATPSGAVTDASEDDFIRAAMCERHAHGAHKRAIVAILAVVGGVLLLCAAKKWGCCNDRVSSRCR